MTKNQIFFRGLIRSAAAVTGAAFLLGCGDSEIKTYQVAREERQAPAIHNHAAAPRGARPELPHLHSDVPEGWKEIKPQGMRVASYQIVGESGQTATVSVVPLIGAGEIQLESINMWRQEELGLKPLTAEELKEQTQRVPVGDTEGILVDMQAESGEKGGTSGTRIVGALANRNDIMWFVKMAGAPSLVEKEKPNFVLYLKSLQFHDESHDKPTEVAAAEKPVSTNAEKLPPESGAPKFKAPENWTEKAPGPMVTSAYDVKGGDGQAEVTISKFPGAVGGMVPNINRWRDQLGLAPLADAEASKSAEMLEVEGKKNSYLIDIQGTNKRTGKAARMIAVGVPHGGDTWFFKLLGDEVVVAKEKEAFVRFIVSAY
jgi:hypothetical protein